jgi:hypothetical protein
VYRGKRRVTKKGKFRSDLEAKVAYNIETQGSLYEYESLKIKYTIPTQVHTYLVDFLLPNGIIIEAKGLFETDDRKKHLLIKEQHPELDIRFVFSSLRTKIYPKSPTTVGEWCTKHGFLCAEKAVPSSWLSEPPKPRSLLQKLQKGATIHVAESGGIGSPSER